MTNLTKNGLQGFSENGNVKRPDLRAMYIVYIQISKHISSCRQVDYSTTTCVQKKLVDWGWGGWEFTIEGGGAGGRAKGHGVGPHRALEGPWPRKG